MNARAPLLTAALAVAACTSSESPPSGPAVTCVGYQDESRTFLDGGADEVDASLRGDAAPACVPFPASDLGKALTCTVFATLDAAGDESLCQAAGLDTPDADTLRQLRSQQQAERPADGGAVDWSTKPTCVVPPRAASGEAGAPCGSQPGWCLETTSLCESQVVFSPQGRPDGALITIVCEDCAPTPARPGM
jgi:hypothetical protein